MKLSFEATLTVMKICYAASFETKDYERRQLTEGIFFLADYLENLVTEQKIPTLTHALASIGELRDMANDLFKDSSKWVGTERFNNDCYRLLTDNPGKFQEE